MFTVENGGMPFHKQSYKFGNLIIQFKIKFPNQVDAKTMNLITEAFGDSKQGGKSGKNASKKEENKDEVAETCML